jgi:PhnB protein
MMCDDARSEAASGNGGISLAIGLTDPDRAKQIFGNLAKGGPIVMPIENNYWAEAFGMVTGKFGVKWMVNCEAPK